MMTYVFDIDGTICSLTSGDYEKAIKYSDRIGKINKLYYEGNYIIFYTARGMGRNKNNSKKAYKQFYDLTVKQLAEWGVQYHELFMGKPSGDAYIDDKGMRDVEFFRN